MATFSKASQSKLELAHKDLQKILNQAIKEVDFTIICSTRTKEEQFKLFKQGRTLKDGKWEKNGPTVTNISGINKKSMHNYSPSLAVDLAPWPIDWERIDRFKKLAEIIKRIAYDNKIEISWGGDWKMKDYPHFELKNVNL